MRSLGSLSFRARSLRFGSSAAVAAVLGACASTPSAPDVPAALRVPAGQVVFVEALASGVQIYECSAKADGGFEWAFKAPEATLSDRSGKALGRHYAGPTWEALDGSRVVGDVKAKDPGPDANAIPWLLLSAKSNAGAGLFSAVKSVQRVATVGGAAPAASGCTDANLKQVARVPYKATYYFYRAAS